MLLSSILIITSFYPQEDSSQPQTPNSSRSQNIKAPARTTHVAMAEKDVESGKANQIPHLRQVYDQAGVTPEVEKWEYAGSGTEDDPYVVTWIDHDPRNPMLYSGVKKWSITALVAIATLAVAFVSSAYSGGANEVIMEFGCSQEVYTLGISLFVLGFAIG